MLNYEKIEKKQILCRFRGEDLKKELDSVGIGMFRLANALDTYPMKIKRWQDQTYVTVDEDMMKRILQALRAAEILYKK